MERRPFVVCQAVYNEYVADRMLRETLMRLQTFFGFGSHANMWEKGLPRTLIRQWCGHTLARGWGHEILFSERTLE